MTDLPVHPDTNDGDAGARPDRGSASGRPRKARVLGIAAAIVLVVVLVLLHLAGVIGSESH